MLSAICFSLDQSKILLSSNRLRLDYLSYNKTVLSKRKTFANAKSNVVPMIGMSLNSLPNDKIVDWSKLKEFANDNSNGVQIIIYVHNWEENTVGKEEKCWLPAFSSFPTMFSKASFLWSFKVVIVW